MKNNMCSIIEWIVALLDIFNNQISITSILLAFVLALVLCKSWSFKNMIICFFVFLLITIIGIVVFAVGNTLECLWLPMVFIPALVGLIIGMLCYYVLKFIIKKF